MLIVVVHFRCRLRAFSPMTVIFLFLMMVLVILICLETILP